MNETKNDFEMQRVTNVLNICINDGWLTSGIKNSKSELHELKNQTLPIVKYLF